MRQVFKGDNYSREETIRGNTVVSAEKLFFFEFRNPMVTVHKAKGHSKYIKLIKGAENFQGRKLYEEIRYLFSSCNDWYKN